MTKEQLFEKAKLLPLTPGVYLMHNKAGTVIYVGKSKALRNRVSSYFNPSVPHFGKTEKMINSVDDFEVYHTATELEALLQENAFIKQFMPHYNIKLKDSEAYPYIRLSAEPYPRLSLVYTRKSDKDRYFGPFSSAHVAKAIVTTANKTFGLPTCNREFPKEIGKARPCLDYHIGQCCGVCIKGQVSEAEYKQLADSAAGFLKGDYAGLIRNMTASMLDASEKEQYERAAAFRDRIEAVKRLGDKQQIVGDPELDADVIGVYADDLGSAVVLLFIRGGAITDRDSFFFGADELMDAPALECFLQRYYELRGFVPKKVCVSMELPEEETELLTAWLSGKAGGTVHLYTPKRGELKALTDRACENASGLMLHKRAEDEKHNKFLLSFASLLQLEVVPDRIESYDVSNSGDDYISCGMIVLENGRFAKRKYRSFNLKNQPGQSDVGSLTETLSRRFSHDTSEAGWEYPDLILMDGGIPQVHAAQAVLAEKGLNIPVFGMIKDEHHKTRTLTDGEGELSIAKRQDVFVFLYKIQEEVHRYALSRMDVRRRKAVKQSSLVTVKGIGEKKAQTLLAHFGSFEKLKAATKEELLAVSGINEETADNLLAHFRHS